MAVLGKFVQILSGLPKKTHGVHTTTAFPAHNTIVLPWGLRRPESKQQAALIQRVKEHVDHGFCKAIRKQRGGWHGLGS